MQFSLFFNSIKNFLPLHSTWTSICKFILICTKLVFYMQLCFNCVLILLLTSSILTELSGCFKKTTTEPHLGNILHYMYILTIVFNTIYIMLYGSLRAIKTI